MKRTFTGKNRIFLAISGIIIAAALIMQICGAGINLGIDFTGGSLLTYSVGENYDVEDVNTILKAAGYTDYQVTKIAPSEASISLRSEMAEEEAAEAEEAAELTEETAEDSEEVTEETAEETTEASEEVTEETTEETTEASEEVTEETTEETTEASEEVTEETEVAEAGLLDTDKSGIEADGLTDLQIRLDLNDEESNEVRAMIETEMTKKYPDFVFVTIDHVSATAGKDLIGNAVKALLIAFVCMLIYIAIRFDFYSGVVALGALVHDVLIMFAFMVFFQGIFQANSPFIAAVLTIVGYSINNTIIVFARIRENGKKPGQTAMLKIDIVEMSVKQTLSRTANTTITTMITLVALYIFGVDSIREFAFPLIVGMLAGTYSSVLLSGQVWAAWVDSRNAKKAAKDNSAKA